MPSTERSEWEWLYEGCLGKKGKYAGHELHMTRVENEQAGPGTPDGEGCLRGNQFWLELKVCARPVSPSTELDLSHIRPKQVTWNHNRCLVGGRAWFLVRVEGNGLPTSHYLVFGRYGRLLKEGLTEAGLNALSSVPHSADPALIVMAAAKSDTERWR